MRRSAIHLRKFALFPFFLLAAMFTPCEASAGETEALLLSCMDYRLIDETERYMTKRGLRNKYDHIILAGASLGATTAHYPSWNQTFWDHLDVSIKLHSIKKVIVLDHRDCGAYKVILKEDLSKDPGKEKHVHKTKLHDLKTKIKEKYPHIGVELHLMDLSGNVEPISH